MKDLNLSNPIFVFYIDVDGHSKQHAMNHITQLQSTFAYSNITSWIVPIKGNSRVECIWDPSKNNTNIEMLGSIMSSLDSEKIDFKEFKKMMREWKLTKITDEEENRII